MGRLSKDAWLGATSLQTKEIEVPELGGSLLIRELPGEFATSQFIEVENPGTAGARSKINYEALERKQFHLCVVDENNSSVFTEDEVKTVFHNHGSAVRRVIRAIDELSAIDKEGAEKTAARFPDSGAGSTGSNGSDGGSTGDAGPDQPVRAGAGVGDDRG